jgi:hypothetical protein
MTPNKENIKLWVLALRSGKYTQGIGQLKYNNTFCCLGVVCDIYDPSKWREDYYFNDPFYLPLSVQSWLGIEIDDTTPLIKLNDEGVSFEIIADYIEEKYLKE